MPREFQITPKRRSMAKWYNHREAVKDVLKRRKKTIYWLSKQLEGTMSRDLLYSYLRGRYGISVENQEAINRTLGLRYTDE